MKLIVTVVACGFSITLFGQQMQCLSGVIDTSRPAGMYAYRYTTPDIPPTINIPLASLLPDQVTNTLGNITVRCVSRKCASTIQPIGMEKISLKEIKNIPVFLGEKDLLKIIQLLPGIQSAGDGNSGFYVRGGGADQNLILLDGAPVYNASHLMGFFSTFNNDAIKDFSLYKGGMPAQYGGRLSSVLDVAVNEGSNQEYKVSGGIGLVAARLNVEGPLQKNKSSFLVSGRRTYADLFLKLSHDSSIRNNDLNFYDLNLKMNYTFSEKNQLSVSAYLGHDLMRIGNALSLDWGNKIVTLQWRHRFSNRATAYTSVFYSHYNYTAGIRENKETLSMFSQISDLGGKAEIVYVPGPHHETRVGAQYTYHTMLPGQITTSSNRTGINNLQLQRRYSLENAFYINNVWALSGKTQLSYGMRLTSFSILGEGDFYNSNSKGAITDTFHYGTRQIVKTYLNAEPRIAASHTFNKATLTFSYVRNVQNLHLLANATSATPTDRWVASTTIIKPEIADQVAMGYSLKTGRQYEFTVETYYKALQHQIDYRDGAEVFNNEPVESKLLFGKGRAYGIECLLKKKAGKLTGWIAYTLSKTERKINGINNNDWYRAKQDRTHDISVVSSLQLSTRWVLSANWVFSTGNAVTLPAGKYIVNNQVVYYYTGRNGQRMPAYHRLDLAATVQLHRGKSSASELNFGVYNAYGRENAYSISFRKSESNPLKTEAVQLSLFRFIPSVTYNFKF